MSPLALLVLLLAGAPDVDPRPATAAPAPARATQIAVRPDSEGTCPSPAQVNAALAARLPGALVPAGAAGRSGALELALKRDPAGAPGFVVTDSTGRERLRRSLTQVTAEKECAALAETVALIVERFLAELDDRSPPLALDGATTPKEGRAAGGRIWDLSLTVGWRPGDPVGGAFELGGRAGRLLGARKRWLLAVAAGVGGLAHPVPGDSGYSGTASLRRVPVEAGLWWLWPARWLELQAGATVGLELTRVTAAGTTMRQTSLLPGPNAALCGAIRIPVTQNAFFRVSVAGAAALIRYDFAYRPDPEADQVSVFAAPTRRFYGKMAAEVGLGLPLMKKTPTGP